MWHDEWIIDRFDGKYAGLCREYNSTFGTDICRGSFKYHCQRLGLEAYGRYYTDEERQWLIENYPMMGRTKAAERFKEKFGRMVNPKALEKYCHNRLHVWVSEERKSERYDEFRLPIGTLSKNVRGEWKVKTEDGWVLASHQGRDVPEGYVALHIDRNPDNNEPENIAVVRNGIHTIMMNWGMWSEEPEITKVALTWCELYKLLKEEI